jgi:mannose-6-phosphate isomerase
MFDQNQFDKSQFTNHPFAFKDTTKPWGWEIIFTKPTDPYTGKIIHLNAGKRFSLQAHESKQETQMLISGEANLIIDNENGEMITIFMEPMRGYTILPGQRHRVQAITNCDIYEVSKPETGTTFRLEDDYQRKDQTEEVREEERKNL